MEKYKKLNEWFNLDNYDILTTLTIERIKEELFNRIILFYGVLNLDDKSLDGTDYYKYYENIISGNPLTTTKGSIFDDEMLSENDLTEDAITVKKKIMEFSSTGVQVLFKFHLQSLCCEQLDEKKLVYEDGQLKIRKSAVGELVTSGERPDISSFFMIDINNYTDEEILHSIKELLPKIRKELDIQPTTIQVDRFSDKVIQKIIDYKIIAIIDLCAWAKLNKYPFSYEELARIIFPIGRGIIKSGVQFSETILPFAMKALSSDFIRSFELYIKKMDRYKKNTPINRLFNYD